MSRINKKRVFVLGLDGATFDLIKPWINEGELPNFSRLLQEGCHGELESIIPPLTTPAWASFMTGKNPGNHGIFDFAERKPGSYDIQWVTSLSRRGRSLWNIISSHGKQVVAINIPNNYPLEKVNGYMVAWMDATGNKRDYAYPPELIREIEERVKNYIITIIDWKGNEDPEVFRNNLHLMIDKRAELTFYLMESKPWDFFTVLFSATDIVQHCFWSYMDPSHPLYNPADGEKYGDAIKEVYRHIDQVLGDIQARLDTETTLVLMSDHGAGPLRSVVNLNRWLEKEGLLTFHSQSSPSIRGRMSSFLASASRGTLHKSLSIMKRRLSPHLRSELKRFLPGLRDKLEGVLFSSLFDWHRTKAYSLGSYGNIYINLKNREPDGIVNEGEEYEALRERIASRLTDLTDPVTGERVVKKVYRREEIYKGPFLSKAADLIVHWSDAGYHSVQRFGRDEDSVFANELYFHLTNLKYTGYHRLNGIFAIIGRGVCPDKEIKDAKIVDIAPTALYLLGLPIPDDMDGRVLKDAFLPEYLEQNPTRFEELLKKEEVMDSSPGVYDEEESKKIAERLKNLGYID
jgi:predicted AlkP superfamily phosphohydrolase/phosphomutase